MTIEVRGAGLLHIAALCVLEARCFGCERVLAGHWQRIGQPGVLVWMAHVDGDAAGFQIAYPKEVNGVVQPYVAALGVVSQHRRRGIARKLLQTALEHYGAAWLHVRASNTAAIALYESMHLVQMKRVEKYYNDGEDALLMARIQRGHSRPLRRL